MLVLSTLHQLLSQFLSHPHLHTAVLLTPAGELVSSACCYERPKDDIRVLVGLSGEIWRETRHRGFGMVDSEMGRIAVAPVDTTEEDGSPPGFQSLDPQPVLLVALNATDDVDWGELHARSKTLGGLLGKPLRKYREALVEPRTVTSTLTQTGANALGALR
ncbi:hypothetical protein APHAL10511_005960 [Amanita phalloides]|nr:hypothetical protein APHAL10511_005960 [Amanita phalloides]